MDFICPAVDDGAAIAVEVLAGKIADHAILRRGGAIAASAGALREADRYLVALPEVSAGPLAGAPLVAVPDLIAVVHRRAGRSGKAHRACGAGIRPGSPAARACEGRRNSHARSRNSRHCQYSNAASRENRCPHGIPP